MIGGGLAGLAAAVEAHGEGAAVTILEKEQRYDVCRKLLTTVAGAVVLAEVIRT